VDEVGANTAMARRYGRGPRGERVIGRVPQGHWKAVTLTAAMRLDGVAGCPAFDGATDAATFETHVERCLVPTLRPGDIVVMDNLGAHKGAEVGRLIGSAGAEVRYPPAYSPDLNPIEKMSSKLETDLREVAERTVDGLYEARGEGQRTVIGQDIVGWFRSCGYSTPKRKPL
jgi:transposase